MWSNQPGRLWDWERIWTLHRSRIPGKRGLGLVSPFERALTVPVSGGTFGRSPRRGERNQREEGAGPADSDLVAAFAEPNASGQRHRSHRGAGWRRLLGRGASGSGGPRPDVFRRRQADDRLRLRFRQRDGHRAPAGWQDRRGGVHVWRTSPSPATTPTARSTRASPATAGRSPISRASRRRTRRRSSPTARSSWSAPASAAPARTSCSPATTPTARSTRASPATAS